MWYLAQWMEIAIKLENPSVTELRIRWEFNFRQKKNALEFLQSVSIFANR